MLTGEPLPVEKTVGDKVTGGTVNGIGGFVRKAERIGRDTLLGQIVSMVAEAQRSRAPIQGPLDIGQTAPAPGIVNQKDSTGPWNQGKGIKMVQGPAQPIAEATASEVKRELQKAVGRSR